jgi:hypothetical protein
MWLATSRQVFDPKHGIPIGTMNPVKTLHMRSKRIQLLEAQKLKEEAKRSAAPLKESARVALKVLKEKLDKHAPKDVGAGGSKRGRKSQCKCRESYLAVLNVFCSIDEECLFGDELQQDSKSGTRFRTRIIFRHLRQHVI